MRDLPAEGTSCAEEAMVGRREEWKMIRRGRMLGTVERTSIENELGQVCSMRKGGQRRGLQRTKNGRSSLVKREK